MLNMPSGYNTAEAVAKNTTRRFYQHYGGAMILIAAVFLLLLVGLGYLVRRWLRSA